MNTAARQLAQKSPWGSTQNPEVASTGETSQLQPGQPGYLPGLLEAARKPSPSSRELPVGDRADELFNGDNTKPFAPPSLEAQATNLGEAQPITDAQWGEQNSKTLGRSPFADALSRQNGTQPDATLQSENPNEQLGKVPGAETKKPLTQQELLKQMVEARKKIDAKDLQEVQAGLAQAVLAAKEATVPLNDESLRNAALNLENNQADAGIGKITFARQLEVLARRAFARQKNLAQLARQELAAKQAKKQPKGKRSGAETGRSTSAEQTKKAHDEMHHEVQAHQGA